ncbi:MAG: MltR family transcriptional regulator [Terracidiphilus sp.]
MAELIPMAKKRRLRAASLEWEEFEKFLETLQKESDRGAVLISAALLDDLLERCMHSFLLDHSRVDQLLDNGPLGSFGARILAAFALGMLSESEYQDCERVRKVRNSFAHGVGCSFENQKVKDICSSFVFVAKPGALKDHGPRERYLSSVLSLLISLSRRPAELSRRRLKFVE